MSERDAPAAQDDVQVIEWREPPGYLGEAVRRAKQIPRGAVPPVRTP